MYVVMVFWQGQLYLLGRPLLHLRLFCLLRCVLPSRENRASLMVILDQILYYTGGMTLLRHPIDFPTSPTYYCNYHNRTCSLLLILLNPRAAQGHPFYTKLIHTQICSNHSLYVQQLNPYNQRYNNILTLVYCIIVCFISHSVRRRKIRS